MNSSETSHHAYMYEGISHPRCCHEETIFMQNNDKIFMSNPRYDRSAMKLKVQCTIQLAEVTHK